MTQAQQPEALRIAMHLRSRAQISSTPGNLDTLSASAANELERQHARILELEQGKCLHQIAEPVEYPHLPQSVADVVDFMGGGKVDVDFSQPAPTGGTPLYTADQMRAYVDADRTQRAAASQAAAHPDDAAVDALAVLMKAKLAKQRAKGCGGWDTDCTQERLSDLLRTHVNKGDPVDVANFCAFLAARGEMICLTDAELINAMEAHRVTEHQRLLAAAPALYVSPEQLENHTDHLASEAGRYLPARKTAVGKFTMPLYAHPAEEVPAPEMNEDGYLPCPFCGSHRVSLSTGQTGDGTPWHYVECESCAGTAEPEKWNERATQPAAQGLDAPNEWEGIHTMPTCDDLIWLYCQDTNTIDGPIAPDPSLEQYGWTHWAYANAPSTAGIDAAQAQQGGAV